MDKNGAVRLREWWKRLVRQDLLERTILWRMARRVFSVGGAAAFVGTVVAAVVVLWTLTPVIRKGDPPMPPEPLLQLITADELARLMPSDQPAAAPAMAAPEEYLPEEEVPVEDARVAQVAELMTKLQQLVSVAPDKAPWMPSIRSFCTYEYAGRCYQTTNKVVSSGLKKRLEAALGKMDLDLQLRYLRHLLQIGNAAGPAMATRGRALEALVDIRNAYVTGADTPEQVAGMESLVQFVERWLLPPNEEGVVPTVTPRTEALQNGYFQTLLEIRKRGSAPGKVQSLLERLPELLPLGPTGPETFGEKVPATLWALWVDVEMVEAQKATDNLLQLLPPIAADKRLLATEKFVEQWRGKQEVERLKYGQALAERASVVQANDMDLAHRRAEEAKTRTEWLQYGALALLSVLVLALFLTLFGIERNTRLLEAMLRQERAGGERPSQWPADDEASPVAPVSDTAA